MLYEKAREVVDEIFDELTSQYCYLKGKDSITDVRLLNYVLFTKEVVHSFNPKLIGHKSEIEAILKALHFSIWEDFLFDKNKSNQCNDSSWMLLRLEKQLLNSNAIYEQFWNNGAVIARCAHQVVQLLASLDDEQTPMQQGDIWEIKGSMYIIGAPFALKTDLWLRSINDINQSIQYSYRLSDFMPLIPEELKLRWVS